MPESNFMTAAELASAYRARTISPVEVTRALLDHVEARDRFIDSFLTVTRERAMADARTAEQQFMRGEDRGPMQGIPYGLKDIIETAGIRTTGQSRSLANHVPAQDAAVAAKLAKAGGVLIGKNTTWEFAHGGAAWDVVGPPAHNPWNPDHHPAGSSSGTGAAIAAGFITTGIGTDTGGSVRMPAAACGIAGLKPTYGRVSRRGIFPNSFSHDHAGPMARNSRDVAMMLQVIAGYDAADPGSADVPVPDYMAGLSGDLKGMRVGVPWDWLEQAQCSDGTMAAFKRALEILESLGASIVAVELPSLEAFSDSKKTIAMSELFSIHNKTLRETPDLLGASLRYRIQCGALIRAEDYLRAMRLRTRLASAMQAVFKTVDLIACPCAEPAGKLEKPQADGLFNKKSLTTPFNSTGNPAISINMGFSPQGLPYSLQIAGRLFEEASVLRAADAYECAAGWLSHHPDLFKEPVLDTV
ncbi:MAG: amidase [Rhodobacteraceae bacterium]|nr:MAG: amidase [Paracoccaceae bacterium]